MPLLRLAARSPANSIIRSWLSFLTDQEGQSCVKKGADKGVKNLSKWADHSMYTGSLIIPIPYTHKETNLQIPSSFVMKIMWFFI